jgi:ribonuclease P protein component
VLRKEISEVIETGKKIEGLDWWARYKEGAAGGESEEGALVVMISKKIVKLATRRNRIRRKIRESLRVLIKEKNIRLVVYVRKDNEKIGDEIVALL